MDDRTTIDCGASQGCHAMCGALDELEVRLVLIERRRLQRQESDVGRMQKGVVTIVRTERLECLVRGRQGVEKGAVIDDLDPCTWSPSLSSTSLSAGMSGAQSASRLRAPKKIVIGPDDVSIIGSCS